MGQRRKVFISFPITTVLHYKITAQTREYLETFIHPRFDVDRNPLGPEENEPLYDSEKDRLLEIALQRALERLGERWMKWGIGLFM